MSSVVPLRTSVQRLQRAERSELVDLYALNRSRRLEWLRRQILYNDRIDLLARHVLGYQVMPFHLAMLQFQFRHPLHNLQLVYRGAGKSTLCTVTKAIHMILKDPNIRILIASKTTGNAEAFLKEIKAHFESNTTLSEIFGPFFDARKVKKWDTREIEVLPRKSHHKESTITCVGVDGTIVSKHYEVILSDDLVDEDNTRTPYMRDKTRTWFYKTLDPCLEPPDAKRPHCGEHHMLGTRYHFDDLYGHLISHELEKSHQIIKPLDESGNSTWPERHPPEWFLEKKKKHGLIIYQSQYDNDVEAMKGEIFEYDDCQQIEDNEVPSGLTIFMGVDLAIKLKKKNDQFAIVVIGRSGENYYVLDHFVGRLRVKEQTRKIIEFHKRWKPVYIGLETNAYQDAQAQLVEDEDVKDLNIKRVYQDQSKDERALKLTPTFENGHMFFVRSCTPVIDQVVGFPNHRFKDLFDALELAVKASKIRTRKKRRGQEPGVI